VTASLPPHFDCPRCGARSYNPNDIEHGYCGRCHDWTRPDDVEAIAADLLDRLGIARESRPAEVEGPPWPDR
jgi:hypothetical protein